MGTLITGGRASVGTRDRFEQTAVHHAVSSGCADGTRLLLQHGADVDAQDRCDMQTLVIYKLGFNKISLL